MTGISTKKKVVCAIAVLLLTSLTLQLKKNNTKVSNCKSGGVKQHGENNSDWHSGF